MAYDYGAKEPEKLKIKDMTPKQKELLIDSDTFCMMPWLHIHAFPDGRAYPCCFALDKYPVGDLNKNSMAEVFNNDRMKGIRKNMLSNKQSKHCSKYFSLLFKNFTKSPLNLFLRSSGSTSGDWKLGNLKMLSV